MKYINFHLIFFLLTLTIIVTFNWKYGNETFIFYGVAENKELEIRLDHPSIVEKIHVKSGTKVEKGKIFLEVSYSNTASDQSDLTHEIAELQSELRIWEASTKSRINQLEIQKQSQESTLLSQIQQLESEMSIKRSLLKDLESIKPATDNFGNSPYKIKMEGLKSQLEMAVLPFDNEIKKLKNELYGRNHPLKIQINKLKNQLGFSHEEEEQLTLIAPRKGIVGSLFCKEGEQQPSFKTLLTFYEEKPTQVKAYVLESLLLKVEMGDSIIVQSVTQSTFDCLGKIVGMGSRIVEIPERLRKNPTFKTYGREILIEIPPSNSFLQKEKVILKLHKNPEDLSENRLKIFTTPSLTSKE